MRTHKLERSHQFRTALDSFTRACWEGAALCAFAGAVFVWAGYFAG